MGRSPRLRTDVGELNSDMSGRLKELGYGGDE